jgi:type VI protein secretion system component VasF
LPDLLRSAGKLVGTWAEEGVVLHAESLAFHAERRWREVFWLIIPLWLIGAGLIAIAVALFLGR